MAPQSSAPGTVCLPSTWLPKKPMRCKCDLSQALGFNRLLLAHSLKPLLPHILASVNSAGSLVGNQSRGNKPRQTTLDLCPKILAPMSQGDRIPSYVCD